MGKYDDLVKQKKPSEDTMRRMYEFFLRTSVPRILAALDRGELVWENGKLVRVKEVNGKVTAKC